MKFGIGVPFSTAQSRIMRFFYCAKFSASLGRAVLEHLKGWPCRAVRQLHFSPAP